MNDISKRFNWKIGHLFNGLVFIYLFLLYLHIYLNDICMHDIVPFAKLMYNFILLCNRMVYLFSLVWNGRDASGNTNVRCSGWPWPLKATDLSLRLPFEPLKPLLDKGKGTNNLSENSSCRASPWKTLQTNGNLPSWTPKT